ncbi:hypothetical protein K7432_006685 [Basidiobolus ranarum]|uniref:Uncharacterized protein n=1 Tax=Basidiobolus ranarum TaxID=34480 RepID=A0ABR2W182_9FUNG
MIQVSLLGIVCEKFDKLQPWGPNEYGCMTMKGPTENSKVEANARVNIEWSTLSCGEKIASGLLGSFDLRLYNHLKEPKEPSNSEDLVGYDLAVLISDSIDNNTSSYSWKVPSIDDSSINENLFFIRVATQYLSHPKKPTLFAVVGPFSILKPQNSILPELASNTAYGPSKIEPPKNSSKLTTVPQKSPSSSVFELFGPNLVLAPILMIVWSLVV